MIGGAFDLFNIEEQKATEREIIKKVSSPLVVKKKSKTAVSDKVSLDEQIKSINKEAEKVLGRYRKDIIVIKTEEELKQYIDACVKNGIVALDTETNNSLDPLSCKLVGCCLYTPGEKWAYIPINHKNRLTDTRIDWQLTEGQLARQLQRLKSIKIIYHNAKFDYEVIKCTCKVELPIYWDTFLGATLIDENEDKQYTLKAQYIKRIDASQEKYDIESLFKKYPNELLDIDIFALYSAFDPYMTYKLYEYQLNVFKLPTLKGVYNVFRNIEIPCIVVIAEMELAGVVFDKEYAQRLDIKYHKQLEDLQAQITSELDKYKDQIEKWKNSADGQQLVGGKKRKYEQLDDPINLSSPRQLSILLYDILKTPPVDKESPRGTGEDILKKIDIPVCKLLVDYKKLAKLLDAFIVALPKKINPVDNKIHGEFKQYGAKTGRQSSASPNLQQIPSKNKEIRLLFRASKGNVLVGSDFSQQEPRLLSYYSQDENMINAYKEGKDLYATIAMGIYHNNYWDNMEHYEDGSPNVDGATRRNSIKKLMLGMMYGMGVPSIAKSIGCDEEEAQGILDGFYKAFPKVKKWIDKTETDARVFGYVEDLFGRRRRLPDITLPYYNVSFNNTEKEVFNPLFGVEKEYTTEELKTLNSYKNKLNNKVVYKEFKTLQADASKHNIKINTNTSIISGETRKCVNARVQGGSASMTKIAMIKLHNDKELNDLGFKLLITVHDELIGECPKENAEKVADRLSYIMRTCIADKVNVPFKCDADISERWYYNEYCASLQKEFNKLLTSYNKDEAFNILVKNHIETDKEELKEILNKAER